MGIFGWAFEKVCDFIDSVSSYESIFYCTRCKKDTTHRCIETMNSYNMTDTQAWCNTCDRKNIGDGA
jgi:hypothetical protein